MRRGSLTWVLVGVAVTALAVFAALTVAVTGSSSLALDAHAFKIAGDLRAPWLEDVARVVTNLGLIAIVGPAVLLGAALLIKRHHRSRAAVLVLGAAFAWIGVQIIKSLVDRPRPPAPLVRTSGQSYPSGHAANSIGWLALSIALTVGISNRRVRLAAVTAGALLAVVIGLSRIYLRAHYASDVLAGEALAVAMYALAAAGIVIRPARRDSAVSGHPTDSAPKEA